MDTEHLKASLKSLHSKLETAGPVDGELRDLLRTLDADIQQLLEQPDRVLVVEGDDALTSGLATRSQELGARFAARHPQLEPALRELGTILANMGI